ncbi:reverse transcriptase domain-containing protein [Tanacetum coccineum]
MEDDVDINTLTMEQYLAWVQDDISPGMVKPKIGNDVEFEINSNFMRELRHKLFKGTDDEDAHEHSVSYYTQRACLEMDKQAFSRVNHNWDLLEKAFIRQYCPPFKTAKKLEEIRNFKQEVDEPLYHAWERYSDLLYRCPQHDLNNQQRVHIFYTGLYIPTRIMLDSKGFIPLMTPSQALKSIQVMADHSRNWYDEATNRERIDGSSNDIDIKKLDENIHVFQAADDEWTRKFIENMDSNIRALKTTTKNQVKADQLTQTILTNTSERIKVKTKMGKNNMKEPVPRDLPIDHPYAQPTPIPKRLKGQNYKTREIIYMIGIPEETHEEKTQINNGYNITVEDVERLRQILTPTIHTLPNLKPIMQPYMPLSPLYDKASVARGEEHDIPLQGGVKQPLTPQTTHITLPDDVAPATSPILDKHSNESGEEFFDITRVAKMADGNPVKKLSDIIKTYDFETFIRKLLHQVRQSSNETGKTKGGMKSHLRYGFNLSLPYPVANLRSHGVHCYSHSHLISSEGGTPYYLANKGGVLTARNGNSRSPRLVVMWSASASLENLSNAPSPQQQLARKLAFHAPRKPETCFSSIENVPKIRAEDGQSHEAFRKHLEEKHVTWARFKKKRDEDTRVGLTVRGDGVKINCDAVRRKGRDCVYFNFSFAIKLEIGLNVRSISTWEDLTTRFLPQFFPPRRATKLRNDILMFQQHHGESLSKAWNHFKDLLQKVPHHGINLWLQVQIFYDHVNSATRHTINHSFGGKLHEKSTEESWELVENLALYDYKSWNDPRDIAKPVKAISLPQDVPSTSDCCLIELENQVQRLMEAHLAPKPFVQVNKIASSCEICGGP